MYTALPSTITDNYHETECSNPILEDLITERTEIIADYFVNSKKTRNEISYDEWFNLVLRYCVYYDDPDKLCGHTKQMLETIYNCYLPVYEGGKYFILYSYEATKDDI